MRRSGPLAAAVALAAAFAGAPAPAPAAVENSPHDLIAHGYDVPKVSASQERCDRCHMPGADPSGLLPRVPASLERTWGADSLGCFSCHDGTTIVSPDVDASLTAFHPESHGTNRAYGGIRSEEAALPNIVEGGMECVTCHDPHENTHRPFLRSTAQELCMACHSRWSELGRGVENRTGNHLLGLDPAKAPRPAAPVTVGGPFSVRFPSPYPLQRGALAEGVHWDLGGHLAGGREGALTCGTCHAVHGDEDSPPRPGLPALEPVNDVANLFCEGCHAGARGDGTRAPPSPNPGGTSTGRTYHPCDDDRANGDRRFPEATVPAAWPVGKGSPERLLCTTCHTAHGAKPSTPLLRPPVEAQTFCESCHSDLPVAWHHPSATAAGKCAATLTRDAEGAPPGIGCASCHRAHNAGLGAPDERRFVPLLREQSDGSGCLRCHPAENPTCNALPDFRASHFLGDPVTSYEETDLPLRREAWPTTGLFSKYADPSDRVVTCLSCHSFKQGALTPSDTVRSSYLVASSGNSIEWEEGMEAAYLCIGCHSSAPATGMTKGHTHPMMNASVEKLGRTILPPVTSTPNGKVNCDSCHRPHEALTKSGYYILEAVEGENQDPRAVRPLIDFTPLCHRCHDEKKY